MQKLTVAMLVSISIAGIFVALQLTDESEAQDATTLGVLQKAPKKGVIRENGTIDSALNIPIVNKIPGTTTILSLARNGSVVQKGDVLFELDDSGLRQQLQEQQIKVVTAQANSAEAEQNLKLHLLESETTLIDARTALEVAEKSQAGVLGEGGELDLRERELNRELKLLKNKIKMIENRPKTQVEPEQLVLQYELMLVDLRTQLETVQEQLEHHKQHVRPLAAAKHEGEVKIAASDLKRQTAVSEFQTAQLKAALEAARLPIDIEQQRLQDLEQSLENCRVVAPRDGMIVYANPSSRRTPVVVIKEGLPLRERQKVMTLVDPENRIATMYVHESRLAQLKVGQSTTIGVDALPNQTFSGRITSIADSPDRSRWPRNEKRYEVVVEIEKPQPELKPGLSCNVEIDVSE